MLNDEQLRAVAHTLMLSPTMQRLGEMAVGCPFDLTRREDVKGALAACTYPLIQALDAERVHFEQDEDRALFYGLLMTAVEIILDGRLKQHVQHATVQ